MNAALQAESVAYSYPHHGYGLKPVSLEVNAGEIVLLQDLQVVVKAH